MAPGIPHLDVSVVFPCLDEAVTLGQCIAEAQAALRAGGFRGEVIVADNGSTDGSQDLARAAGARVVDVPERGYGNALRAGIDAAHSELVVFADADHSYDISDLGAYVAKLREGFDLVNGDRFAGGVAPGAMPALHRYLGNPGLSWVGRVLSGSPVRDFHSGIRGIRRDAFTRLAMTTTGFEFTSEMILKAKAIDLRVAEIPATLRPDGRTRRPHLRSWRDGWRHLRFMLLFTPRWLFLLPGLLLTALGGLLMAVLVPGPLGVGAVELDIHTMLVAGFAAIVGYQLVVFAAFTKVFAVREGFHPQSAGLDRLLGRVRLEAGLLIGLTLTVAGGGMLAWLFATWQRNGLGHLDTEVTMRQAIPAVVLASLGVQTIFASFFLSILGIPSPGHNIPGPD